MSDQQVMDKNMYKSILFLFFSSLAMKNVPIGIENKTGVRTASPINPYFFHKLTMRLERLVKTFFCGILFSMY